MILNSNMIFWTPILEYRKIISLQNSKLSLSQPVTARKKTNTNLRRNVCEPQLRYIPNDDLAFFSLGAVRALKNFKMLSLRYTFTTGRAHYGQLILYCSVALILCGSFVFCPCFAMQYFVSILVLQSFR